LSAFETCNTTFFPTGQRNCLNLDTSDQVLTASLISAYHWS
jgi:hypothetical protein